MVGTWIINCEEENDEVGFLVQEFLEMMIIFEIDTFLISTI